jgi:hypothetical protein
MPCFSQERDSSVILDKQASLVSSNASVGNALFSLSNLAKVPIGFIGVAGEDENPKKISVKVMRRTVREVLDEIVKSDNRYKWEIVDGIINVYPVSSSNCNISELTIGFLQLSEIEVSKVGVAILKSPEIHINLEAMGKKATEGIVYSGPKIKHGKISVVLSNIQIRDALNGILSRGEARFWTIETIGKRDEFVRLMLID